MSKIERYQGNVQAFASSAQGVERTVFGETTQANDLTSQITAAFLRGWGVVGPSEHPSLEDFNGAMYALSQFIAYQHQSGIPEWHEDQEYYAGSVCTHAGVSYQSLEDANTGNEPPSAQWTPLISSNNGGEYFQSLNVTLTALAMLSGKKDQLAYFSDKNTADLTALTAFAREILAQTDAAGVLSKLGLGNLPDTFGSAASADVGTGSNQLPNTSQADMRYKLKKWVSPGQTMVSNTATIVNHGLTIDPDLCVLSVRLRCLVANNGYAVGEYAIGFGPRYPSTSTGMGPGSLGALLTSTYVQYNSGPSGDLVTIKSNGSNAPVDYSQWALEFRILYQ